MVFKDKVPSHHMSPGSGGEGEPAQAGAILHASQLPVPLRDELKDICPIRFYMWKRVTTNL